MLPRSAALAETPDFRFIVDGGQHSTRDGRGEAIRVPSTRIAWLDASQQNPGGEFDPTGKSVRFAIFCLAPIAKVFRFPFTAKSAAWVFPSCSMEGVGHRHERRRMRRCASDCRHCEERKRRSNPCLLPCCAMDCFACARNDGFTSRRHPRERLIQYWGSSAIEPKGSGVLDTRMRGYRGCDGSL